MNELFGVLGLIASVTLGASIVFFLEQKKGKALIKPLLSFSGGFLLAIAFIHFIPEIYKNNTESFGVYILIGFLMQLVLEYFTGGIEHGHVHVHKEHKGKLPWGLLISLSIHSILEGIPLEAQFHHDPSGTMEVHNHSGMALLLAIILHKIPEAIALTTLFVKSEWKKTNIIIVLAIFALMSPLGVALGHFAPFIVANFSIDIILAIVVGMFLHISTTIIFETSEGHKFNLLKLLSLLAGAFLAMLMH